MPIDIETLRASAKRLKKAFAANDPDAIRRLQAAVSDALAPKHADFLHAIARENGHESWPKLKFAHDATQMSRMQRSQRLAIALYNGQRWIVEKLLADDPTLVDDAFSDQIATYDLAAVKRALARDPAAATQPIGIRTPILHLAFSKYIHMKPEKRGDMLAIAELLVANGANVNDGYPPEPGSKHTLSALYGALGHANNLPLAQWLLEHGASPDDNESLYHATELGHHDGLRLLIKHGVQTKGTNALPRALDFNDITMVRLLLEHGADPNEAMPHHPRGQPMNMFTSLHHAARRWCSADVAALLLDFGGNALATWQGHTAYGTACIYGNAPMARLLEERGLATPLSANEAILAECATGKAPSARLNLDDLHEQDRRLLTELSWGPVPLDHFKALVAAGIDPNHPNEMGLPPLQVACWEGLPERAAYFLALKPDLTHRNKFGGNALGTTIHGAEFCPKKDERDHVACARLLLEAGMTVTQDDVNASGNEAMALFLEGWLER